MNIQARPPTTPNEFLRWNEGRKGKREFVRGQVVEMIINVTEAHYRLAARLLVQLATQLDPEAYVVGSADFGVRTPSGIRYPDVMVHRPSAPTSLATDAPLLIAEIPSPSTKADDIGPKARDYLSIPSLLHYVVVAQAEAAIWLWARVGETWSGPRLFDKSSDRVELAALGAHIDPRGLYSGIVPAS